MLDKFLEELNNSCNISSSKVSTLSPTFDEK